MNAVTIPATEWRKLSRFINQYEANEIVNDLVNRKTACEILDISSKALTNYICLGKVTVETTNAAGQSFFSRKKLLGLK